MAYFFDGDFWTLTTLIFLQLFFTRLQDDYVDYDEDVSVRARNLTKNDLKSLLSIIGAVYLSINILKFGLFGIFALFIISIVLLQNKFSFLKFTVGFLSAIFYLSTIKKISSFAYKETIFIISIFIITLLYTILKRRKYDI
ncbi:MAG: hypothetical protein Q4A42_04475 [Tissierellia bacterium]|nr:hypothetical protein [Tissierellia bacterium]